MTFQKLLISLGLINFGTCYVPVKFNPEKDVDFLLRIRNQSFKEDKSIDYNSREEFITSAFDKSKSTVFLVHGYTQDRNVKHHIVLSKDILDAMDVNLFFVDWGKGAKFVDYTLARSRVNDVAKVIGDFNNFLAEKFQVNYSSTTCIGFSLGAHVCGLIYKYLSSGKFGKIIGLDPARPDFDINNTSFRLNSESATYVECIHTGFSFGIRAPICQADFFVNKGSQQPGCISAIIIDGIICSHSRAVSYFSEALRNPSAFYGKLCSSYANALSGECNNDELGAFMGNDENSLKKISGIYHVVTNSVSPYGRGK